MDITNWIWMLPFWLCPHCKTETTIFVRVLNIHDGLIYTRHSCRACTNRLTMEFDMQNFAQLVRGIPPICTNN